MSELLDAAGRRRSPVTLPEFHAGRPPRNKGMRYPADPPTIEEIIAVMRRAGNGVHGRRLRGLIVVLWRAGLRICEALALAEADLDARRGSLLVRRGKGGRRREVGMDDWAREQLEPWLQAQVQLPVGPLFCIVKGPTRGWPWTAGAARTELRRVARDAGVRRRLGPHQLRHAHAVEMAREGVPLIVIQRQLGRYVGDRRSPRASRSHNAGSTRVIGAACYLVITRISNTPTSASPRSTSRGPDALTRKQAVEVFERALGEPIARRRSQRTRLTWERMRHLRDRWLPWPNITHPWPTARFDARTEGRSPVR